MMATSSAALQLTRQLNRASTALFLPLPSLRAHALASSPRRVARAISPSTTRADPCCGTHACSELRKHPVEGFSAGLVDDDNVFEWEITIFGCVPLPLP